MTTTRAQAAGGGWRRLEAPRGAWDQVDNKVNEEHRIG